MRKFFTLFTMCMLAAVALAADITFDPEVDKGDAQTSAAAYTVEKDGVSIHVSNGLVAADQGVWAYRVYKGQIMTVSCESSDITKIVIECTVNGSAKYGPGCFVASQNTYTFTEESPVGTWEGTTRTVDFTASTNQVRATKITVTVGQAGLSAPVITPAAGTYYEPINVSIACNTSGAKIYYTLDGSNPTTSSTQYTNPIHLSSNTTVNAISALDGQNSAVVSAAYVFVTPTPVSNIAAYQTANNDDVLKFNNPVSVLAQNKNYLFVKDNSGYALFYGSCGQTYKNGDVIPAGFVGTKIVYNGEPELKNLANFQAASSNSPIAPVVITPSQVNHDHFANYVVIENVTLTTNDNKNYIATDANGEQCAVYFGTMGVSAPGNLDTPYDLVGVVGSYGSETTVYQLLPTQVKPRGGMGLGGLPDVEDGTVVTIGHDAIVLGQKGYYLYLKDETGFGLAYGSCGKTYNFGDIVPAGYGGEKTTWDGEPELKNLTGFETASGNIGGLEALMSSAENLTPTQVAHETWGHFAKLSQVIIDPSAKTMTDSYGNSCAYYDRFGIALPADLTKPYDVYGIVGSYGKNTIYQLLPVYVDAPIDTIDVANIEELYQLPEGALGHFTTRLTAIYQNGQNLYVKDVDGTYSLAFGPVDGTFVNGDYIVDALSSWGTYQSNPQMKPDAPSFVPAGHGTPVDPEIITVEEVSTDMVHWYVGFENAMITLAEDGGNATITDETGSLVLYDKFNVLANYTGDLSEEHYIEGFLTVYRGIPELYPTYIDGGVDPCGLKGDVNGDGEVNIGDTD